ncbi:hypothetical protein LC087_13465 [Bacillus carboniphilus]|uniref:Uncharacterized protein n=1 Tax=Bacillus carboniphilus TaxID=86663 RepID=A0ABY9JSX5_9BACI|nr:hypothetical protein [Bacillus carboniphilus]WLR41843.1 hypothetical protein LC087_13465 [Bacillus carboniphilus]
MGDKVEFVINRVFRYMLFLSSYLPLFIILFLMNINNLLLCLFIWMIITVTILTLKMYLDKPLKATPNFPIKLDMVYSKGSEALNYIVTYIIPFISFNSNITNSDGDFNIPTIFAFLVLFLVIGYLYMHNNLYHINPVLSLFYDINIAHGENGENLIVVSEKRKDVPLKTTIYTRILSPGAVMFVDDSRSRLSFKKVVIFLGSFLVFLALWNKEMNGYLFKIIQFTNTFINNHI